MPIFSRHGPEGTGKTTKIKDYIYNNHRVRAGLWSRSTNNEWNGLAEYQEWFPVDIETVVRANPSVKHVVVWDEPKDVADYFAQADVRAFYELVKSDPDFVNVVLCIAAPSSLDTSFYTESVPSW